ncbi:MAG: uracil-DNA glycosylase family protein [Halovenus sp.]
MFYSETLRNPFGLTPPCERYVPGYGDADAHFHVVGDHPGRHGGLESGIPFTGRPWSAEFFEVLQRGGLVTGVTESGGTITGVDTDRTFLSYLHACASEGEPTEREYTALEATFDAELRAIAAHVLIPVGRRATRYVLETHTARETDVEMADVHATEIRGSGWLVVPVDDPEGWADDDADRFAARLEAIRGRDYRREADLGRFLPGEEPYFVR